MLSNAREKSRKFHFFSYPKSAPVRAAETFFDTTGHGRKVSINIDRHKTTRHVATYPYAVTDRRQCFIASIVAFIL
jgi:hypothetical protein